MGVFSGGAGFILLGVIWASCGIYSLMSKSIWEVPSHYFFCLFLSSISTIPIMHMWHLYYWSHNFRIFCYGFSVFFFSLLFSFRCFCKDFASLVILSSGISSLMNALKVLFLYIIVFLTFLFYSLLKFLSPAYPAHPLLHAVYFSILIIAFLFIIIVESIMDILSFPSLTPFTPHPSRHYCLCPWVM